MTGNLADQLQVWGFEKDLTIFSDGSLGFGLDVTPIDATCWDDNRVNRFSDRVCQFLNGLPTGISIQFIQDICRGNEPVIDAHKKLSVGEGLAYELVKGRTEKLRTLETQGFLPRHALKIFVRRPSSKTLLQKPKLLAREKLFEPMAEERLVSEITETHRLRDQITSEFKGLGMKTSCLSVEEVADLIYVQWNPTREIPRGAFNPEEVRSSLVFTDSVISERGFSLGGMQHRVVSLKFLPEQTFSTMAASLRELPFDSRLFLTIQIPDQTKEISQLQTQRRVAFSLARGKRVGVSDIESESKLQDLEGLLEEMVSQGEKVFHASLNVLLRSESGGELEAQVSQTLMKLRELSSAEGMEESLASFDLFCDFSIPNVRAKERSKRIKTSNLSHLLPLFGPWPGHPTPSVLLRSRQGSLISFNPFSPALTNYNQIVSGGSGSGKSFLANVLLLHMLKEDPKVLIVDIGGSYKKLSDNLGGQYIPLGADSNLALNPFDLAPGETSPSSHKIKFLVSLVELMTKEDEETRLPRLERAELEEAIEKAYAVSNTPTLSTLREILLKHSSLEIKRLGRVLGPWCGDTPYGRFIDKPTTILLQKPIVTFDLKGMESYPDLQAVALFIITDFVWREVQRDRQRKKFLIFDECWKLLESDAGASFIAEVFRTFRKYYASAIAISQNVDDFAKSKVSGAILSNSAIKWILMQKGADQSRLQEVLQLNDNEMRQISSLHQERGLYSEVFLMAEEDRCLAVVESTPLEYWLATTDPRDLSEVDKAEKLYPAESPAEILLKLSKEYPYGVANHLFFSGGK